MMRALLVLLVVLTPTKALAQNTRDAELASADAQLNATYRSLIRQLGQTDQSDHKAAQRAWIAFRDLDCKVGWGDRRDCLMARTQERERQLRDSIYWTPTGEQIELPAPRD
jgi:uncharacterized protein YecT (DUF1311 family)